MCFLRGLTKDGAVAGNPPKHFRLPSPSQQPDNAPGFENREPRFFCVHVLDVFDHSPLLPIRDVLSKIAAASSSAYAPARREGAPMDGDPNRNAIESVMVRGGGKKKETKRKQYNVWLASLSIDKLFVILLKQLGSNFGP